MKPLTPVEPGAKLALGIAFFVLFFAVWALATLGGFVSKTFWPTRSRWSGAAGCC